MKILLLTLMLALLVGCGNREIVLKMTETPSAITEEETASETTEQQSGESEETAEDVTLDEAAAFAENADYTSAIVLLQEAMEEAPDNAAYQDAYAAYCEAYKTQTIAIAEELAAEGAYLGAIRRINSAVALIGSDEELSQLGQDYAAAHMDAQMKQREEAEVPDEEESSEKPEQQEQTAVPEVSEPPIETKPAGGTQSSHAPFYGIWCFAAYNAGDAQQFAAELAELGFDGQVFVTTDWSNLNQSASLYVVSAGVYATKGEADSMLASVRSAYPDAYVKYSGSWQG